MPFDYEDYSKKCDNLSEAALQKEWQKYTRQIAGGSTSTVLSVAFVPFTAGISLAGLGVSGPRIHNARKKRAIIEEHLKALETTHHTRKRDVLGAMALSSTIGGLTLGMAPGADDVVAIGAEAGVTLATETAVGAATAAGHLALDGAGIGVEHVHDKHNEKKAGKQLDRDHAMMQRQFTSWKAQEKKLQEEKDHEMMLQRFEQWKSEEAHSDEKDVACLSPRSLGSNAPPVFLHPSHASMVESQEFSTPYSRSASPSIRQAYTPTSDHLRNQSSDNGLLTPSQRCSISGSRPSSPSRMSVDSRSSSRSSSRTPASPCPTYSTEVPFQQTPLSHDVTQHSSRPRSIRREPETTSLPSTGPQELSTEATVDSGEENEDVHDTEMTFAEYQEMQEMWRAIKKGRVSVAVKEVDDVVVPVYA